MSIPDGGAGALHAHAYLDVQMPVQYFCHGRRRDPSHMLRGWFIERDPMRHLVSPLPVGAFVFAALTASHAGPA